MITRNQLASEITNILGKPTDFALRERVKSVINHVRAMLLRQSIEKNSFDYGYIQRPVIELKSVDIADTCIIDVGCVVRRSVTVVPIPLRYKSDSPFLSVSTTDGKLTYTNATLEELNYVQHVRYSGEYRRYVYLNNYLYVKQKTGKLKYLGITGVWEDPTQLSICQSDSNTVCYNDDMFYPIPEDIIPVLKQIVLKTDFNIVPKDNEVEVNKSGD